MKRSSKKVPTVTVRTGRQRALVLLLLCVVPPTAAAEARSTAADRTEISVTVYQDDLALVREVRRLRLPTGESRVALADVSAKMQPETAELSGLGAGGAPRILEQTFDFDLLTPEALLEKYAGRRVRVVQTHPSTGVESEVPAEVLSTRSGVVLRIGDRIETGVPGRLVFERVPEGLRERPTLSILVSNPSPEPRDLALSYLTAGLTWRADYVATLGAAGDKLSLRAWATLANQSGIAYPEARVRLVAGDVQRVRERKPAVVPFSRAAAAPDQPLHRSALFEYHLYALARPTTIAENQSKQVALLAAPEVPAKKELVLEGDQYYFSESAGEIGDHIKTNVYVEFANRRADGLGTPLPAGIMRVYQLDGAGAPVFVGEHRIDHTPEGETLRLHIGRAFDVTGRKVQTDFRKLPTTKKHPHRYESAYRITLANAKTEPATVTVRESMPGSWRVLAESQPHRKLASNLVAWDVTVPASGSATLTYRALVEY